MKGTMDRLDFYNSIRDCCNEAIYVLHPEEKQLLAFMMSLAGIPKLGVYGD